MDGRKYTNAKQRAEHRQLRDGGRRADKPDSDFRLDKEGRALVERILRSLPLPGYKLDAKLAICDTLIANLLHRAQRGRLVRVSRDAGEVKNYRISMQAQNALVMGDMVEVVMRGFYDRERGMGEQTRYAPTGKLLRLFEDVMAAGIGIAYAPSELVVLKDQHKQSIPIPDDLPDDTAEYLQEREWLIRVINLVNDEYELKYRRWDAEARRLTTCVGRTFSGLHAVYSNGDFAQGGRLYGDYHNLRREERATLTIGGVPTVELDYACLHPAMLYNYRGLPLPADAYGLYPDQGPVLRRAVKIAFNVLINSDDEAGAVRACNQAISDYTKRGRPKPFDERQKARALKGELERCGRGFKGILQDVCNRHAAIAADFYSGAGLRLQNDDVELVYHVCGHFCRRGVPVLPVHDSFIIQVQHEAELREVMVEAYRQRHGFEPVIR